MLVWRRSVTVTVWVLKVFRSSICCLLSLILKPCCATSNVLFWTVVTRPSFILHLGRLHLKMCATATQLAEHLTWPKSYGIVVVEDNNTNVVYTRPFVEFNCFRGAYLQQEKFNCFRGGISSAGKV